MEHSSSSKAVAWDRALGSVDTLYPLSTLSLEAAILALIAASAGQNAPGPLKQLEQWFRTTPTGKVGPKALLFYSRTFLLLQQSRTTRQMCPFVLVARSHSETGPNRPSDCTL